MPILHYGNVITTELLSTQMHITNKTVQKVGITWRVHAHQQSIFGTHPPDNITSYILYSSNENQSQVKY